MKRNALPWICVAAIALAGVAVPLAGQSRTAARPAARPPVASAPAAKPAPAAPAARAERPVPFRAGEVLVYDVSWSSYVTAGTATVTVREKRPSYGSTAYYIVAEGRPTPLLSKLYTLYYKADTLLDSYSLLPQRGSIYSEEGKDRRTKTTSFNQGARTAVYEVQTATNVRRDLKLPAYSQDALSAIYVLRAIPFKQGASITMPVTDSGRNYKVQVKVGGREPVRAANQTMNAWRITPAVFDEKGKPAGRSMYMWISDDERKLPLKLSAELAVGSFQLTLREAR
jgi:hypothetical protein